MDHTKRKTTGKHRSAFTLVELVVVITILAILGTIGFLSVGGYSSRARDSERVADVAQLAKSLDLSIVTTGNYPMPDGYFTVAYSGGALWYQGTAGAGVMQKLHTSISGGGLDSKPSDPLKGTDYAYSILAEGKAYQIKAEYENDLAQTAFLFPSSTVAYAAPGAPTIAYVRGNYGGLVAKTTTGSVVYVVATPSILTNSGIAAGTVVELKNGTLSGTLLFNGKSLAGASSYNPGATNVLVFSGANLPKDDSAGQITAMVNALKTAYTGSDIASSSAVATLLGTPSGSLGTFGMNVLLGQLGGTSGGGSNGLVSGQCSGLPANAAYYGSAASYSLSSAPAGTSLSASGVTTPAANTCQFSCSSGYSLNGNSCVSGSCTGNYNLNGYSVCLYSLNQSRQYYWYEYKALCNNIGKNMARSYYTNVIWTSDNYGYGRPGETIVTNAYSTQCIGNSYCWTWIPNGVTVIIPRHPYQTIQDVTSSYVDKFNNAGYITGTDYAGTQ